MMASHAILTLKGANSEKHFFEIFSNFFDAIFFRGNKIVPILVSTHFLPKKMQNFQICKTFKKIFSRFWVLITENKSANWPTFKELKVETTKKEIFLICRIANSIWNLGRNSLEKESIVLRNSKKRDNKKYLISELTP